MKHQTRFGYIDRSGRFAIEPRFERARPFHCGLALVRKNGEWNYIDHLGDTVIENALHIQRIVVLVRIGDPRPVWWNLRLEVCHRSHFFLIMTP